MSEMMQQPPPSPGVQVVEPMQIKVFGILHVVFGCLGAIQILIAVVSLFFGDALARLQSSGNEQMYEIQRRSAEELRVVTIVALLVSIVVTFLILKAGIKLLKTKKDAVKASTTYSFASLGAKIFSLILAVTYTIPIANRQFDSMSEQMAGAGGASLKSMMEMTKMMTSITGILSPILMCIYPLLCLFLLKKKNVVQYLELHGK